MVRRLFPCDCDWSCMRRAVMCDSSSMSISSIRNELSRVSVDCFIRIQRSSDTLVFVNSSIAQELLIS